MRGARVVLAGFAVALGTLPIGSSAATPPPPQITFYFGLTRPEAQASAAFYAVSQPGSATYRRFLTPAQVSARYGAPPAVRSAFMRAASALGFSASIDPSGVFARVTGTVAQFEQAFHVSITSGMGDEPAAMVYGANGPLTLPPTLRGLVQDATTSYNRQLPAATAASLGRRTAAPPARTGRWTRGCPAARATGAFSYTQVRHAYGIDRVGRGTGATVAILGLTEAPSAQDIADNARCFGYRPLRSTTLLADGQTYPIGPGVFEPQEDLALVRGMAPDTSIEFAQAWSGADQWYLGLANVLDAPRLPDVVSISYGICENDVRGTGPDVTASTRAGADLFDSLAIRLGLAGVGVYASAGDAGSSCNGLPYSGVAWPASSSYVTAVGGTRLTLNRANHRRDEVVWNDLPWRPASQGGGAGGGGLARFSGRPPFQVGLAIPGAGRAVPDVAAAASSFPGWPVVLGGNWEVDGGTSAAAPLVAAAVAVLDSNLRSRRQPSIGPADGLFYWLARHRRTALWDVVRGNNGYFRRVPAQHARRGYDLASGLGVPRWAQIVNLVPRPGTGPAPTSAPLPPPRVPPLPPPRIPPVPPPLRSR